MGLEGTLVPIVAALLMLAAATTTLAGGGLCWIAPRVGLLDHPDRCRKLQKRPVALGGGIAVFFGFWLTVLVLVLMPAPWSSALSELQAEYRESHRLLWALFGSSSLLLAVGLWDDRLELGGKKKLLLQLLAIAVVIAGGFSIPRAVLFFGTTVELGILAVPLAAFWMLATVNSVNLIDGMDGVATTVVGVICIGLSAVAFWNGQLVEGSASIILAASLAAFFLFNRPPARMYLGDAGSMVLGLLAGSLTLAVVSLEASGAALITALAIWTVPLLDSSAAVLRRRLRGYSVFTADRGHLHHHLYRKTRSPSRTLVWLLAMGAVCVTFAIVAEQWEREAAALAGPVAVIIVLVATRKFGGAELQLLTGALWRKLGSAARTKQAQQEGFKSEVHLQGGRPWQDLWTELLQVLKKLDISVVQLEIELPSIHESFHGVWTEPRGGAAEQWRLDFPLRCDHGHCGWLMVAGQRRAEETDKTIESVLDAIHALQVEVGLVASAELITGRLPEIRGRHREQRAAPRHTMAGQTVGVTVPGEPSAHTDGDLNP